MAYKKLWGPFICAGCGRKIPYLIVDASAVESEMRDEAKTVITCFACHGTSQIATTALLKEAAE